MELLKFINEHSDWREILTKEPYNLIVKDDEPYFLLKYDMLNSDMSNPLVQEARGCIFRFDKEKDCYICVCHPFDKFFNAHEGNAAEIDWDSATVYEKVDGCFTAKDKVLLADGTSLEIGRIVKDKMDVEVMSYNKKTGIIEPKKVIGWKVSDKTCPVEQFRTIKLKKVKTSLYGKLSQHNIITPTINHVFFRKGQDGNIEEVSADKLVVNDILYTPKYGLTNIEKQVILGTLLGDGSMTYYQEADITREKGIRFTHSRKQKDYVWYKYSLLKNLGGEPVDKEVKDSFNCEKTFYQSNTHPGISELYPIVYNNYKKAVNKKWLEQLDWLGMAIWYMDDGHYDKGSASGSISLHTEGFSIEENELIHQFYNKKGLKNYIRDDKKGHYFIHFSTEASNIIWSAIAKYIPECMEYKLPERFKKLYQEIIDTEERPIHLCEGTIESIEEGLNCHNPYHSKSVLKYDIEVADNHNYFCQGVLVHNSLIKFWYDLDEWHISTNSTIDARKAEVEAYDGHITFYNLVLSAFGSKWALDRFMQVANPTCVYMFELVSPHNRLVVPYEHTELYYIGCRSRISDKENSIHHSFLTVLFPQIRQPKIYNFKSIDDVLDAAASLSKLNEGFVVCDKNFNRIKVKGAEYLEAFHIRGNGKITQKKVVKAILDGYIDDMIGFFGDMPEILKTINDFKFVEQAFEVARAAMENHIKLDQLEDRKAIAEYVKQLGDAQSYCFAALKNPEITAFDYLKKIPINKVLMLME